MCELCISQENTISLTKDSVIVLTNMQLHFPQLLYPRSYQLCWGSDMEIVLQTEISHGPCDVLHPYLSDLK